MSEHHSGGDLEGLRAGLKRIGPMVVAFSGGADSAFLAWVATDTLGSQQVRCATAVSPSLAPEELADCRQLASEWGLAYIEVETDELADPAYSANDGSRCFHCKSTLMEALVPLARAGSGSGAEGGPGHAGEAATVVLGVNLDDLGDHRPGQQAAAAAGARFPLVESGFTKAGVREWSRQLGLRTWDKPAAACLASRVPYGTPVTLGTLRSVAESESALRSLGFTQLRVRHYGDTARIEVPAEDLAVVVARRDEVSAAVHAGRLPLRDPGPRRIPLRQPQRRPGRRDQPVHAGGHREHPVIRVRVRLTFPEALVREPIIARMVKELDIVPNIRRADVGEAEGWIICELDGDGATIDRAVEWLRGEGVQVDLLGDVVES